MADTSELLHTVVEATNILFNLGQESGPGSKLSARDRATINDVRIRLDAAKSRLQAEAPEDAELDWLEIERVFRKAAERYDAVITGDCSLSMALALKEYFEAKLRARTSQAEAQAPTTANILSGGNPSDQQIGKLTTTAASVLTVGALLSKAQADAVTLLGGKVESYDPTLHCDNKCLRNGHCMGGGCDEFRLVEYPRFTVGAPAPAPTMPTREQIARTLCIEWYSESVGAPAYDTFGTSGKEVWLKQADAILALIAKGDTP